MGSSQIMQTLRSIWYVVSGHCCLPDKHKAVILPHLLCTVELLGNSEQVDLVRMWSAQYVAGMWSVCGWYVVRMWLVKVVGMWSVGKVMWCRF